MKLSGANIRATAYYIARRRATCPHCKEPATLLAIALALNHEILDDTWQPVAANAFIFKMRLGAGVERRLEQLSAGFRVDQHGADTAACWTNHCEHCRLPISDDSVHCEPGVFVPWDAADAANIELLPVAEAFEAAAAGYALEPEFFEFFKVREWPFTT